MMYSAYSGACCYEMHRYVPGKGSCPMAYSAGKHPDSIDELIAQNPVQVELYPVSYHKPQAGQYHHDDYYAVHRRSYDVAAPFLENGIRPLTRFVSAAWQIKDYILSTFEHLMGRPFPDDVVVEVCGIERMKRAHEELGGQWHDGIMGFAARRGHGASHVFVLQDSLDRTMLVVGHELGHVLGARLERRLDEEAKAFAFEFAWARTIKEHNVADLRDSIRLDMAPAGNGLHDTAFSFVRKNLSQGQDALEVFFGLLDRSLSVT